MARYRTRVGDLGTVVALAAAGVGLAVVPHRSLDPGEPLDVCALLDPVGAAPAVAVLEGRGGAHRRAVAALARHVRQAARAHPEPPFTSVFNFLVDNPEESS